MASVGFGTKVARRGMSYELGRFQTKAEQRARFEQALAIFSRATAMYHDVLRTRSAPRSSVGNRPPIGFVSEHPTRPVSLLDQAAGPARCGGGTTPGAARFADDTPG